MSVIPPGPEHEETLCELLGQLPFFSMLSDTDRQQLAALAHIQPFKMGETLLKAGSAWPGVAIVLTGRLRLIDDRGEREVSRGVHKKGSILGEVAGLRELKSDYVVRGSGAGLVAWITQDQLHPFLQANPLAKDFMTSLAVMNALGGFIAQLFDLQGRVNSEELRDLVGTVGIKNLPKGKVILEQDDRQERRLYVVRQGHVQLDVAYEESHLTLAKLKEGDIFGEKSCLLRQPQVATARALTDVTLFLIPEATVRTILGFNGSLRSVLEERINALDREFARQRRVKELRKPKITFDLGNQSAPAQVLKRFPLVQQAEEMDCSAACLTMICQHHGLKMSLGKIREMVGVGRDGASLEQVARVAENLGFHTRGVSTTFPGLKDLEVPFIAHWEGYHFVVVYGLTKDHVWLADPGPGFRKLSREDFDRGWSGTCLTLSPGELTREHESNQSPWSRYLHYLRPHRRTIIHVFIAALVIQLLGLLPPIITQNVLDRVVVHQNESLLIALILALVFSQLFAEVSSLVRGYLSSYMTRSIDFAMMSHFFAHTLALPMSFFTRRRSGDIMARFQENQTIRAFLTNQVSGTILNCLMVVVYLTAMFFYNVQLTLIMLAFVAPVILLVLLITSKVKDYSRKVFDVSTESDSVLMETLNLAESVKGMGIERSSRVRWEEKYVKALNIQFEAQFFQANVGLISKLLSIGGTVTVLYVGAHLVMAQEFSVGQLVAFNMFAGAVMGPLMALVGVYDEFHSALVSMERLGDVLDMEPEQKPEELNRRIVIPDLQGHYQIEDVSFRYQDDGGPWTLQNIKLEIKPGEMVALVGLSGSGKSTLARLLMGFEQPSEGKISVDGYDLAEVEIQQYRSQVGYVMQANMLFQGTIEENIAVGDDEPDRARIVEAARQADAHDFINALPLGYQHPVGERGAGLSGGQVQRLCIARALYRDPRVLILDEATSSLDAQSEGQILENMEEILKGRSALIIAHRLSTVVRADKILVLYNGSIVEQGTHESLLASNGMYQQLVRQQLASAT